MPVLMCKAARKAPCSRREGRRFGSLKRRFGGDLVQGCRATSLQARCGHDQRVSERLVHDGPDRAGAAPAIRTAAETAIHLSGRARAVRPRMKAGFYVAIGKDVAGADDHRTLV